MVKKNRTNGFSLLERIFYPANLIIILLTPQYVFSKDIGTPHDAEPSVTITMVEDVPQSSDHYSNFLKATYQHKSGKIPQAILTYQHLLKFNPSPHVYLDIFNLLFDIGQYESIVKIYKSKETLLGKILKDEIQTQLILAQSYLNTKNDEQAEKIFKQLVSKYPDNEKVAYFATLAYLKHNNLVKANEIINTCLNNPALKAKHFLFHFLQSKLLTQQNRLHDAITAIEKSIQNFPKFERAWLLRSILLEQHGRINDAISGYKHFLDLTGRDVAVEKQLIQLLFSQNRYKEALNFMKQINACHPTYFFDLALIEFKAGKDNTALSHINKVLKMNPQFPRARFLKIDILLHQKKYPEILANMEDWIIQNPADPLTIHSIMLLRKAGIPTTSIIKTLKATERSKPHFHILAAIADLYTEMKDYKQALKYFQKILSTTQDANLKSKTMFQIGYLYSITNQHQQLEQTLKKATTLNPVYPSTYNLLAYHYAQTNKKLPKALTLINKALAIAPECYYYLDTKGLILSKLGKKREAVVSLKLALEYAPHDQTIHRHLKEAQEGA